MPRERRKPPSSASRREPPPAVGERRSPWAARLLLVLAGLLLPVAVLALAEGALALFGIGGEGRYDDPYVGFAPGVDLFVERTLADGRRVYETNPAKLGFFNEQSFPADKAPGTVRIFALGGSTTAGRPYDARVAFARWLELYLAAADPSRRFEVINAGGISYASYRVAELMKELVRYRPDAFVVYTGHNEFLEKRTYQGLLRQPPALRRLGGWLAGLRVATLARHAFGGGAPPPRQGVDTLAAEVETRLDVWTGLAAFHRDPELARSVVEHFAFNLERMADLAADAGAGVVWVAPISNLKDFSPFKSEHRAGLAATDAARFAARLDAGRRALAEGDAAAALAPLEEARAIDPEHAEVHFRLGRARLALGELPAAEAELVRAKDLDAAPLRAIEPLVAAVREVAARRGQPLVDLPAILAAAGHPLPGDELLLDHVHPDVPVHSLIAERVMAALGGAGVEVRPVAGWGEARRRAIYEREVGALDRAYYARRDLNLAKVLGWAGKLEEAEPPLLRAAEVLGDDPDLRLNLGTLYLKTGRPAAAAGELERAVALDPASPGAHFNLGVAYGRLGRPQEAVAELEEAVRRRPEYAEAWHNLGVLRGRLGDAGGAVAALERARALDPTAGEVERSLAAAYRRAGEPDRARALLEAAVERAGSRPEAAPPATDLAAQLAREGRLEDAAALLDRALAADPGYVEAYYDRGLVESRRGRPEAAAAAYRDALALDPAHAPSLNNLALAAAGRGALGEARELLERAVAARPDYAEAWLNLGVVADQSGDPEAALAAVERAVVLDPDNPRSQLALGMLYRARGEPERARPHLEAAAAAGVGDRKD